MLVFIDGIAFPSSQEKLSSSAELQKFVNRARKRRKNLKEALTNSASPKQLAKARHNYVGSAAVRFAALVEAAKSLPLCDRLDIATYQMMATHLDISSPSDEPVYVRIKPKASGGHRLYCDFGVRQRAAQKIVADMLRPTFIPMPFQFDVPGGGVHRAVRAARKYISNGYKYGRHLDVKSFYDRISHEFILGPALKMEPGIQASVLTGKFLKLEKGYDNGPLALYTTYCSEIASAGTPQGSATSPLVASILLSKLDLSGLPEDVVVLNYVDDFLILAKEATSLEAGSNALQAALTALSAGDLTLIQKATQSNFTDFTYLGHHFHIDEKGMVTVTVASSSVNSFNVRVDKRAEELEADAKVIAKALKKPIGSSIHSKQFSAMVFDLAVWIKSWLLAFSEADDIHDLQVNFGAYIAMVYSNLALANGAEIWASAKASKPLGYSEITG